MLKFLLAAHLVLVVFTIGPLVHAATTASRGIRRGDGIATASAARMLRIYAFVSTLVVVVGFGLMSQKRTVLVPSDVAVRHIGSATPDYQVSESKEVHVADFADTWIWLSALLWLLAMAIVLGVLVPTLTKVTKEIEAENSVVTRTGRVAAAGGAVALIFLAVVVLMVYKPGS